MSDTNKVIDLMETLKRETERRAASSPREAAPTTADEEFLRSRYAGIEHERAAAAPREVSGETSELQSLSRRELIDLYLVEAEKSAHNLSRVIALEESVRRLTDENERLRKGEFICNECGLRKDGEITEELHADF